MSLTLYGRQNKSLKNMKIEIIDFPNFDTRVTLNISIFIINKLLNQSSGKHAKRMEIS